jgi:hypothetical protein
MHVTVPIPEKSSRPTGGRVSFEPGVNVHVSGHDLITKHSHGNGKEINSFPNSNPVAFALSVDVSHLPQDVKLSISGMHGALM